MVSIISQPYTSAGFSYSSSMGQNSIKQNRPFGYDDLDRCVFKEKMIYKEIKEEFPTLNEDRYRRMLKSKHYPLDSVRVKERINADLIQLHNAGVSAEKIAEKYEWSLPYCKNRLRNLGISALVFEKEEFPETLIAQIRQMAEVEGKSQQAISKKLKMGVEKIRMIMSENEIMTPAMKRAEAIGDLTKKKMLEALAKFGNIKDASKSLGVSPNMFKKHARETFNIIV